ncbi:MAG: hypothetical protein BWY59_02149 [Verrucomicrobia bacterium ADurb.Bin345]|nr:MAG: hypothetical protein BWY59_02149 [Verrucomicrobia bacterium ADurb.Bin345]
MSFMNESFVLSGNIRHETGMVNGEWDGGGLKLETGNLPEHNRPHGGKGRAWAPKQNLLSRGKFRVSNIQFRYRIANVAETTAMTFLSSEEVSFIP